MWYVADFPDTRITNWDGSVNGSLAFKIDNVGINQPLIGESINVNGIFEPGEIWDFIIDGYQNNFGAARFGVQLDRRRQPVGRAIRSRPAASSRFRSPSRRVLSCCSAVVSDSRCDVAARG